MALTASDIYNDAVALAFPYTPEWATARGPLLRKLSQLDDKIVDMISLQAPERLSVFAADIPVTTTQNQNGYILNTGISVRSYTNFKYIDNAGAVQPITIYTDASPSMVKHPAGVILRDTFFPIDPSGQRWADLSNRFVYIGNGDKIAYQYVPGSAVVGTMSQILSSPDEARSYLAVELALQIVIASRLAPQETIQSFIADRKDIWDGFVLGIARRGDAQTSFGLPRASNIGVGDGIGLGNLHAVFVSGPTTGTTGVALTAFTVDIHDTNGQDSAAFNAPVTVSIGRHTTVPSNGTHTLTGTLTKNAVAGVVTFDDLVITLGGGATSGTFSLVASAGGVTPGESPYIAIT